MKVLGHPLHLMLIHFPSALFPMDLACAVFGHIKGDLSFTYASFYAMTGGVLLGWLAVITGAIDLLGIIKNKPHAIKKAVIHGSINTTMLTGYSLLLYIAFKNYPDLVPDDTRKMVIKGGLVAFMLIGNYLGGSLVLKDKMVMEK